MIELATMNTALTTEEQNELERCEVVIRQGLETFVEVGTALMTIRDKRLYRIEYRTFENYCRERWGMSKTNANRLVSASATISNLTPVGVIPTTERQVRPLTPLVPEIQREVWAETLQKHGENPPSERVEEVAREWKPVSDKIQELEANNQHDIFNPQPKSREEIVQEAISTTKRAHVANNSGNNEWYTPEKYIESARAVMGSIDLDPASSDIANETVKAEMYYTIETDGLAQPWYGNVWMNPPYAQPHIEQFIQKLADENSRIEQAIVLVNNATETKWGSLLLSMADAVCFPTGRIRFVAPDGSLGDSPLQGQMIAYIGANPSKFIQNFKQYGVCLLNAE